MRLLYTLRYSSCSGNCGGDLHLFFTTQNSSDWKASPPAPPPGLWLPPQNVDETLMLSSGDKLNFALYPVSDAVPGTLYLLGAITVVTATGQTFGALPMGQSAGEIAPNQPLVTILQGRNQDSADGVWWDIGFELAVPWDGTSANCTGQWWAIWHSVAS